MANIGKNIKNARMKKNMRQEDLASKLYVTRTTVSNYETNHSNPDIDTLQQIAEVLDTDVNTLIYGESKNNTDRKPIYIMLVLLATAFVLLYPVSYIITKIAKEVMEGTLQTPVWFVVWDIHIRGLLKILIASVIVYLFFHALQIKPPYQKGRKIIAIIMIILEALYLIQTIFFFKQLINHSFWSTLYLYCTYYPTLINGIYGVVFGICSYQTLFFKNTYGKNEEAIRSWIHKYRWILISIPVCILAAVISTALLTRKEYTIYGTITNVSSAQIDFDIERDKMDETSREHIGQATSYGIDKDAIQNIADISDSLSEGTAIKMTWKEPLSQFSESKIYMYVINEE